MKLNKLYLIFILLLLGCSVDEHLDVQQSQLKTYKVAVIMPQSQQSRWERIANWARANISEAQKGLPMAVGLEIEWKDEDAADLKDYVRQIAPLDLRSKRKVSKKCYLCKEVNQRREVNYK